MKKDEAARLDRSRDYITFEGRQYKVHRDKATGVASVELPLDVLRRVREKLNRSRMSS